MAITKLKPAESLGVPLPASIELAPDLPSCVYTSMERWQEERIGALALYCSDGRWGLVFDEFCHKHLLIPRYDRWAVPGGPAWLTESDNHPLGQAARKHLDFLVQVHELERIVLITHFGCAHYGHRLNKTPRECLPMQMADVRNAKANLRKWFPKMQLQSFLAMRTENLLAFHEVV